MDLDNTCELTANTLSNDVLPAFCKPTRVTSISMALSLLVSMAMRRHLEVEVALARSAKPFGWEISTHQNVRSSQSYTFLNRPAMLIAFQRVTV